LGGRGSGPRRRPGSRPVTPAWRQLYHTNRWHKRRARQLGEHPFCELCERRGLAVIATIADHHPPHCGDLRMFWFGPLRSLCEACHAGPARLGYSKEIGLDGWPTDRRHPVYAGEPMQPDRLYPPDEENDSTV
jgi:hypothetical protein